MPSLTYRYALELFSSAGQPLGQVPVSPDWTLALEWTAFTAMRRGRLPAVLRAHEGSIAPIWHPTLHAPHVSGFVVTIACPDGGVVADEIPTAYVRSHAHEASASLVARGLLKPGEVFTYLVTAFPDGGPPAQPDPPVGFAIEEAAQPLPVDDADLGRFMDASVRCGTAGQADDPAVFVPQAVLDEAAAWSQRTPDVETGGVLVGKLHRDRCRGDLFVEITAQIPAPGRSQATRFTYTPDTWTAVRAAIDLRRAGELILGWHHYHPDFCRRCSEEKRRQCTLSSAFFSAEDVHLHRVCFGRAYHAALLLSDDRRRGLSWSFYGWRRGLVEARDVYVVRPGATSQ